MTSDKSEHEEPTPNGGAESDREFRTRLTIVLDRLGTRIRASQLAEISVDQLAKYEKAGGTKPRFDVLARLCRAAEISLDWLATGEGPMERAPADPGDHLVQDLRRAMRRWDEKARGALPEGFILVPRYDVRASAGPGALADDANIKDYLAFREDWIRGELGTAPDQVLCMNAIGDSMEPTIRTGDVILVDRAITRVADEALYVVALEDALLLKRIQPLLAGVELRSDNTTYRPVTLTAAEAEKMRVIGRVRWFGRVI